MSELPISLIATLGDFRRATAAFPDETQFFGSDADGFEHYITRVNICGWKQPGGIHLNDQAAQEYDTEGNPNGPLEKLPAPVLVVDLDEKLE